MLQANITSTIRRRIRAKRRGWVFTPKHFSNFGPRTAVDQALSRLQRSGEIRRLARGIYEFPRVHPQIGVLSPSPEAVAAAVAQKTHSRVTVSEATAANRLGLSNQVPAQNVFLTDGPSREVRVGKQVVRLRHVAPSRLIGAGTEAGMVIQALRSLGPQGITNVSLESLSQKLPTAVKSEIRRLAPAAPAWSQPVLRRIAA
jgi:hypothetical protein